MTILSSDITSSVFDNLYFTLRQKEERLYADDELLSLPEISSSHPYYEEWKMRRQSSERLIKYLQQKQQPLKILEIGCGNGWLSHRLSMINDSKIIGTDINFYELKQAASVFSNISNLQFIYSDIRSGIFQNNQFDIIIFAASIQYFPSLSEILNASLRLLTANGEVHIMDSHLYKLDESVAAKKRSQEYFTNLGLPEMNNWYHHHLLSDLENYDYKMLYKPVNGYFFKKGNPFPWIVITNEKSA